MPLAFGPLTMLIILTSYDDVFQGAYYTFTNLTALLLFFLFGDQETASQKLSATKPDAKSTEHAIIQGFSGYRIIASAVFLIAIGAVGVAMIGIEDAIADSQSNVWLIYVCIVALNAAASIAVPVLIGKGLVDTYWRFRAGEYFGYSLLLSTTLLIGWGLWALPVAALFSVCMHTALFLRSKPLMPRIEWQAVREAAPYYIKEVMPLQIKIGLQSLSINSLPRLLVPLSFVALGVVNAGRLAITLTVALLAQAVSFLLLRVAMPRITAKSWSGKHNEGMKIFVTAAAFGLAAQVVLSVAILGGLALLDRYAPAFGQRFLPLVDSAALLLMVLGLALPAIFSNLLRTRLLEFPAALTITGCSSVVATGVVAAQFTQSVAGLILGFCVGTWLLYVPAASIYALRAVRRA